MNYRRIIGFTKYFLRGSFNITTSAMLHPTKPIEIDGRTGKLSGRYSSENAALLAQMRREADSVLGVYDDVNGDIERFEALLRKKQ